MKDLDCFLLRYFRQKREAKAKLSKWNSKPGVVLSGKIIGIYQ